MVPVLSVYLFAFIPVFPFYLSVASSLSFLSVYLFAFLPVFSFCLSVASSLSFFSVYLLAFLPVFPFCLSVASSMSFLSVYLFAVLPVFPFCLPVSYSNLFSKCCYCAGYFLVSSSILVIIFGRRPLSVFSYSTHTIPRVSHLQCSLGGRTAGSWLLMSGTSHRPSSIKGAPPPSFKLIKHRWAQYRYPSGKQSTGGHHRKIQATSPPVLQMNKTQPSASFG
jgi:hypothetical protein